MWGQPKSFPRASKRLLGKERGTADTADPRDVSWPWRLRTKRWHLKGSASEKEIDGCRDESLRKAAWALGKDLGLGGAQQIKELKLGKKPENHSLHMEEHQQTG